MNTKAMLRPVRQLHLAAVAPRCFAGLMLAALLFLPALSFAACTTGNLNPNPNPAAFAATGDFNGDCRSDILWTNGNTGQIYEWLMNGTTILSSGSPATISTDWVIQGVGDFDGDGKSDILWRNANSGQVYIWLMNGAAVNSSASPGTISTDWVIQGVGDFDGDGKSDILWRNTNTGQIDIWLMDGTTVASSGSPGTITTDWAILGVGDFDGDGKSDILWQNTASGQTYIWLMHGTAVNSSGSPSGAVAPDWAILGVGDFDGDGKSDILWQNSSTGEVDIWLMNGTAVNSSGSPSTLFPPQSADGVGTCNSPSCNGWTILGVGDYDGSGRAGILWRQLGSGAVYIWLMDGTSANSSGFLGTITDDWEIAALAPYGCSSQVLCNILTGINSVRANGPYGSGNPTPSSVSGPLNPLIWDPGAATVAANWAAQCNWPQGGTGHNPNRDGGENIYASWGEAVTGTDAAASWNAEAVAYTYSTNSCNTAESPSGECGHYTQDVWRTTTAVGCAVQVCPAGGPGDPFGSTATNPWNFVVCDFTPPGNVSNDLPY